MKSRLPLLLIFILCCVNSIAQQKELKFKNFTQEEGLPSNESYFVYRDSKNFIWIATDQGVVRYNGSKMDHFNLPDNVIFKIREDNKGRVWFFSHSGKLAYFFNEKIYPFKYNDSITKHIKNILTVDGYVNDRDEVLINSGTNMNYKILGSGIIQEFGYNAIPEFDTCITTIDEVRPNELFARIVKTKKFFSEPYKMTIVVNNNHQKYDIILPGNYYQHYGCIRNKEIFFFAGKELIKLNRDGTSKSKHFPSDILCLQTAGDDIWVGYKKNGATLVNQDLEEINSTSEFKNLSISSINNDNEGGTWFSSLEQGVFYLKNIHVYNIKGDSSLLQPVFTSCSLSDSALLFANKQGLYKLSGNGVSSIFLEETELVSSVFMDEYKNCFFVCNTGLKQTFSVLASKKLIHSGGIENLIMIRSGTELARISKDRYLFTQGDVLGKFDVNKLPTVTLIWPHVSYRPRFLFADKKQNVWVGDLNSFSKLDTTSYISQEFKETSWFFKKGATCMRQMENDFYCLGIRFAGVAIMKEGTFVESITESNGLLSNSVKYLLVVKNQVWVATAKGISVIRFGSYEPLKYTITNIGKNEGFYNQIIYNLEVFQRNIVASTSNGIYVIENTDEFLKQTPDSIPFYINAVNYYKGDTSDISSISVPYENNRIKIKYSAICFNSPEDIKYYYRLDNSDTTWQTITGTELILENLSPGIYHLELKAAIPNQNRVSEIQKLAITIEKPWWQNNWLRLAATLLLIAVVFLIYRNRVNQIKKKEEQKSLLTTTMVELEQTALRSQMNPHFIFNCLTSIQQLIVSGKTTDANEYLVKFARLIRKTLDLSARPYIKIIEEKEYLDEYLFLEQLRIPDQFDYSIEIDPELDINKTEIPNMMLQPIVENSIRHGIKHLENRKGKILVSIQKRIDFIFCSVTDNGIGRNGLERYHKNLFVEQKSYGMDIVRKRLELMSAKKAGDFSIEINDLQNPDGTAAGTEVILQVPYKISSAS